MSDLEATLAAIHAAASDNGLVIIPAVPLPSFDAKLSYPEVVLNGDWSEFLELAVRVGVTSIYVEALRFDHESAVRTIAEYDENVLSELDDEEDSPERQLFERIIERTRSWRSYNSKVELIQCVWMKDGIAHRQAIRPEWATSFYEAAEAVIEDEQTERREGAKERDHALYQCAEQMARHERYSEASNDAKRLFMAEQLFPEHVGQHRRIAELASLIYWWEVEPGEHATLAEKARELYDNGLSARNVAATLKISEQRVRRMLVNP